MEHIDLNCDLGESYGAYKMGMDETVIPYINSANVACGYHAGDPMIMKQTVLLCEKNNVHIGAHPGFPDLLGFGRRNMIVKPEEAAAYVIYQVGALRAFCISEGLKLNHVKLHGALYNMAAKDEELSLSIVRAVQKLDDSLIIVAQGGSQTVQAAEKLGQPYACEVFADRAYSPDGTLVPRSKPGSMIIDESEAIDRVVRMIREHKVTAIDGTDIDIKADTVCVHGDGEKALDMVRTIRKRMMAENIDLKAF